MLSDFPEAFTPLKRSDLPGLHRLATAKGLRLIAKITKRVLLRSTFDIDSVLRGESGKCRSVDALHDLVL